MVAMPWTMLSMLDSSAQVNSCMNQCVWWLLKMVCHIMRKLWQNWQLSSFYWKVIYLVSALGKSTFSAGTRVTHTIVKCDSQRTDACHKTAHGMHVQCAVSMHNAAAKPCHAILSQYGAIVVPALQVVLWWQALRTTGLLTPSHCENMT